MAAWLRHPVNPSVRAASASSACVVAFRKATEARSASSPSTRMSAAPASRPWPELDDEHASHLLVPAQRHGRRLSERDRHAALRDRRRHVTRRRADRPRGAAVGGLAAQLGAAQIHVGALAARDPDPLLAHPHEQTARVERLQAARGPQEAGGRVLHGYSPRVLAMMFFWISDVPP